MRRSVISRERNISLAAALVWNLILLPETNPGFEAVGRGMLGTTVLLDLCRDSSQGMC